MLPAEQRLPDVERLVERTLLVFDSRSDAEPRPDRMSEKEVEHSGRQIRVLML